MFSLTDLVKTTNKQVTTLAICFKKSWVELIQQVFRNKGVILHHVHPRKAPQHVQVDDIGWNQCKVQTSDFREIWVTDILKWLRELHN